MIRYTIIIEVGEADPPRQELQSRLSDVAEFCEEEGLKHAVYAEHDRSRARRVQSAAP